MDEENQINDKLKIMKFSLLHTPFLFVISFLFDCNFVKTVYKQHLDFQVTIPSILSEEKEKMTWHLDIKRFWNCWSILAFYLGNEVVL